MPVLLSFTSPGVRAGPCLIRRCHEPHVRTTAHRTGTGRKESPAESSWSQLGNVEMDYLSPVA